MTLSVIVTAVRAEALDVLSVELRAPHGGRLPSFEPGAHLEIDLLRPQQHQLTRHYSLCNDSGEADRYVIAVARDAAGRGGSAAVHDHVRVGTTLSARGPRNNFRLASSAGFYRFTTAPSAEFEVLLRKSGRRLPVPVDRSVLDVLEENGVTVANSCREGICGSCETTVCAGTVDHRDHVLSKAERAANQSMMVCVSRGSSAILELDL